jgi:ataxia telangiectasia mutated family protein
MDKVLEWVENSTPFGDFIVDRIDKHSKAGQATCRIAAHSRYYPGEWSSDRCRGILSQLWKEYRDRDIPELDNCEEVKHKENLRAAFDSICKHHTPVFRYFFVENFILAEAWYAAKMRYTLSVAVSSIVGHILGIGTYFSNVRDKID